MGFHYRLFDAANAELRRRYDALGFINRLDTFRYPPDWVCDEHGHVLVCFGGRGLEAGVHGGPPYLFGFADGAASAEIAATRSLERRALYGCRYCYWVDDWRGHAAPCVRHLALLEAALLCYHEALSRYPVAAVAVRLARRGAGGMGPC